MSIKKTLFGDEQSIEDLEELQVKQEEMTEQFSFFIEQTENDIAGLERKIEDLLNSGNPKQAKTLAMIVSELEEFQGVIRGNYGTILRSLYTARLAYYSNQIEEYVEETLQTISDEEMLTTENRKELKKNVKRLRKKLENRKQQMRSSKTDERAEAIVERIAAETSEEGSVLEEEMETQEEEVATT